MQQSILLLGAVERQEFDKVLAVAKRQGGIWWGEYFRTFHYPEHLAGWLLTNIQCGYCGIDLTRDYCLFRLADTDHLLPKCKQEYQHLERYSMMNAVASCRICNALKSNYDPNKDAKHGEPIFHGADLDYSTREALLSRARMYVNEQRENALKIRYPKMIMALDACRLELS